MFLISAVYKEGKTVKGKLNDRDAKCPFFCSHTRDRVTCEGVIPDSRASMFFENKNGKKIQYNVFCCWKYENCEMYRASQQKYREET